jgi:hypothetical protein
VFKELRGDKINKLWMTANFYYKVNIININIIYIPCYLRHTVLLLSLLYRKPSNGENYTLRYYYILTASTSYNRRSLVNLFILI